MPPPAKYATLILSKSYFNSWRHPSHQVVFSTEIPCSQHHIEQECRELLELVLDRKVGELACINRQKPVEITANGKGVRFDVYAEGSDSIIYDIEMQNAVSDSIAKRSRYSQGMIDLNLMNRGAHYKRSGK